jgi:hypothetical protein
LLTSGVIMTVLDENVTPDFCMCASVAVLQLFVYVQIKNMRPFLLVTEQGELQCFFLSRVSFPRHARNRPKALR